MSKFTRANSLTAILPGRAVRRAGLAVALVALPLPAAAHGFAQPYDLPIPLWMFMSGAGATVAVTFALMLLLRDALPGRDGYPRFNLLATRIGRWIASPLVLDTLRILSVALFGLVVVAGLIGNPSPFKNIAPTMVWIVWWVGIAYVSALIGDVWALINPLKILFIWAETAYRHLASGRELCRNRPYPAGLGAWPGVVLFLAFAWTELVWEGGEVPFTLSLAIIAYSLITWTGMVIFGRECWLRHGETFTFVFAILARFAPLEIRTTDTGRCAACSAGPCHGSHEGCVNCYACFQTAAFEYRQWNVRPYAVGLLVDTPTGASTMVFVVCMLATVTFDGFAETPGWYWVQDIVGAIPGVDLSPVGRATADAWAPAAVTTAGLLLFAALFVAVYRSFGHLMSVATGANGSIGGELARLFVYSLVPIALAYHLAHYLSFLLIAGQLIIPLASDPLGIGWNLFHTTHYRIDIGIVNAKFVWYTAVTTIVVGHMVAVYLAHVLAARYFGDRRLVARSQIPMLALMVAYTMVSLWILAQPVVSEP
jgi:hypothetical protein